MTLRLVHCTLCLCLLATPGLSAKQNYPAPPPEFFQANRNGRTLVIAPGDVLNVRFFYNPELNKVVKVREDGEVSLELFQSVRAAGETLDEFQKKLVALYSKEYTNPEITVDVDVRAASSAYVTGEVLVPGSKELHGKTTVAAVLAMGQLNPRTASTKSVFLIRSENGDKYRVYKLDAQFPGGVGLDVAVLPGDIVFVPRRAIGRVDEFVDLYIRQILPINPTVGVYY